MGRIEVDDDGSGKGDRASDRREHERHAATSVSVDYGDGQTFLFSYLENISQMGIFIRSEAPFPIGTRLSLRFGPTRDSLLELEGVVVWVNERKRDGDDLNPGMGIRFVGLTPELREAVVEVVRTVAYLNGQPAN